MVIDTDLIIRGIWKTPATYYEDEQIGNYRIGKQIQMPGRYWYYGMDGHGWYTAKNPLLLTSLFELRAGRWHGWMVDSPVDYRAMQKYAEQVSGNVLLAGLGLGLLIHELCKKESVTSITVVERSKPVIDLVSKYLPKDNRINIVNDDFWNMVSQDYEDRDYIIVDIWAWAGADQCVKIYKEEILPARDYLEARYPEAQVIFHSFEGRLSPEELKGEVNDTLATKIWGVI